MGNQINHNEIVLKPQSALAWIASMVLKTPNCALVFGNTIHLHGVSKHRFLNNSPWVKHEMAHVAQYKRYGIIPFLVRYLSYSLKYGYRNNPFEVEAREAEKQ